MLPPPPDYPIVMLPPVEELPDRKRLPQAQGPFYGGTRLFGKVQETQRGQFITTRFFHVCCFPIVPLESYLVTECQNGRYAGFEIPKNPLSIFIGYLRGSSAWIVITFLLFGSDLLKGQSISLLPPLLQLLIYIWRTLAAIGTIGFAFSYLSPRVTRATPDTAKWITSVLEGSDA